MDKPKPNLFIVGVQKAGTTSLHYYLDQHSDIYMSSPKELHMFDNYDDISEEKLSDYFNLFSDGASASIRGEATPSYIYFPGCLEKVHQYVGDAKIVILVRDPVSRAYSHYWHERKLGWEDLGFKEALQRTPCGNKDVVYHRHFSYIERGLYSAQIRNAQSIFGMDSVKIVRFEDLIQSPLDIVNEILNFVELGMNPLEKLNAESRNASKVPRSKSLLKLSAYLNIRIGSNVVGKIIKAVNNVEKKYPAMSSADRMYITKSLLDRDPELLKYYPELGL